MTAEPGIPVSKNAARNAPGPQRANEKRLIDVHMKPMPAHGTNGKIRRPCKHAAKAAISRDYLRSASALDWRR